MMRSMFAVALVALAAVALGTSDVPGAALDAAARHMLDTGTLSGDVAEAVRHAL